MQLPVGPRKLLLGISSAKPGPLYEQIVQGLKREISEGRLAPGTALPSFRGLAEELLVSVITVKRAYEELEREGILYRRQGLGTFVADAAHDRTREVKKQKALHLLREAVREAAEAGVSPRDITRLLQTVLNEEGTARHASRS
jgi:GntR family transcriptional regulator